MPLQPLQGQNVLKEYYFTHLFEHFYLLIMSFKVI